jgi:hypothetical protein
VLWLQRQHAVQEISHASSLSVPHSVLVLQHTAHGPKLQLLDVAQFTSGGEKQLAVLPTPPQGFWHVPHQLYHLG